MFTQFSTTTRTSCKSCICVVHLQPKRRNRQGECMNWRLGFPYLFSFTLQEKCKFEKENSVSKIKKFSLGWKKFYSKNGFRNNFGIESQDANSIFIMKIFAKYFQILGQKFSSSKSFPNFFEIKILVSNQEKEFFLKFWDSIFGPKTRKKKKFRMIFPSQN